jgi:lambda repressor-like predicted transcriptional regulator
VVGQRAGYNNALIHRAECIALAHAAGWSKYRIAQRLGITRHAVDEALTRPSFWPPRCGATADPKTPRTAA